MVVYRMSFLSHTQAVVYIFMSWRDPRALAQINNATARQNEKSYNGGNGCQRYCEHHVLPYSNGAGNMRCCDLVGGLGL